MGVGGEIDHLSLFVFLDSLQTLLINSITLSFKGPAMAQEMILICHARSSMQFVELALRDPNRWWFCNMCVVLFA